MSKSRSRTNDTQKALWQELKRILAREEGARKLDGGRPKSNARDARKSPPKSKPKPKPRSKPKPKRPARPTTISFRDFGVRKKQARKTIVSRGASRNVPQVKSGKTLYVEKFLYESQGEPMPLSEEQIGVVQAYFYPRFTRRRIYMITGIFSHLKENEVVPRWVNFERSMGRMKLDTKAAFYEYIDSLFLFMEEFQNEKRYGKQDGVVFLGAVLEKISLRSNAA